jgi:ATP/maltotriose-dependent transcriptional regulator MalT
MDADDPVAVGSEALAAGRWTDARDAFEASIAVADSAEARFGLAMALWWQGENRASVDQCTAAYSSFRRAGNVGGAVECALWLGITYKANFANFPAANGWIARAERLLEPVETGPTHAWAWLTRAYRMPDLDAAEALTQRALDLAREAGDVDLELAAASQLGLIHVGQGDTAGGLALIDESMAAALGGEPSSLATVVYTCCDMLNACELASDAERAAHWCQVADQFVKTYGCPFLYAECRIYYGSVLTATGRWPDAERELAVGLRITEGTCPGLHRRALTRLAALRVRQGRLEEADQLLAELGAGSGTETDVTLSVSALLLARGDGAAAGRLLERRWRRLAHHRSHLAAALELLVDAHLAAGDVHAAGTAADRLADVVGGLGAGRFDAMAVAARGRVSAARGEDESAIAFLEEALATFSEIGLPFETALVQFQLGRVLAASSRDLAIDHARRALAGFEQLGAALDADQVAAFLRSLGVVARTGPKGIGALTAREQEVLRLLGHGLSNPEIASRLHVSRKTAAHHVSSILSKLGLRNRAAAAAFATGALGLTRAQQV